MCDDIGLRTKHIAVIVLIIASANRLLIRRSTLSLDFNAPDTVRIAHYQNRVIIQEQPNSLDIEATNFIDPIVELSRQTRSSLDP